MHMVEPQNSGNRHLDCTGLHGKCCHSSDCRRSQESPEGQHSHVRVLYVKNRDGDKKNPGGEQQEKVPVGQEFGLKSPGFCSSTEQWTLMVLQESYQGTLEHFPWNPVLQEWTHNCAQAHKEHHLQFVPEWPYQV